MLPLTDGRPPPVHRRRLGSADAGQGHVAVDEALRLIAVVDPYSGKACFLRLAEEIVPPREALSMTTDVCKIRNERLD